MEHRIARSAAPRVEGDYFSVDLGGMRVDTITDFPIFLKLSDASNPVLYREPGRSFTEQVRARLIGQGVVRIYIPMADSNAYHRYLEANLDAILTDPNVPLDAKVETLYDCAQFVVHDILNDPEAESVVGRSQQLVNAVADFLFEDKRAFPKFLKATSLDYHVYTHSVNVFVYSMMLARRLGFGDDDLLRRFGLGALLHDIGKSRVSPETLNHDGPLNEDQWAEIRQHPVWGWEILIQHGLDDPIVLDITRSHHEKLTGTGYPDKLGGKFIPEHVRIVTVCDIFDALTTKRCYKGEIQTFPALQLMQKEMQKEIDTRIFSQFVHLLATDSAALARN